ncbi:MULTISPECIES: hypothetical protein [Streptomyces]|nr:MULTISPECIES: hypothetical protein [Streptomyces]WUB35458.1 hypothetical protein OHN38_11235 [Streptomyces sp. NBC_00588]
MLSSAALLDVHAAEGIGLQVDYDLLSTEAKQLTRIRREFKGIEN